MPEEKGSAKDREETKCIAVHLPVRLTHRLDEYRENVGITKNAALVALIEKGLNSS